jgi:prepilin-type N-terminal cleavage/methylation domain-containing protein
MHRRAYSLIELLVALVLTGVVLAAGGTLLIHTMNNEQVYRQQNLAQQNARTAMGVIADDMKSALKKRTSVAAGTVQATVPSATVRGAAAGNATATDISNHTTPLYFNIFNDNGTTERRVRYWLNGTDLRREIVNFVDEATTPGAATSATAGTIIGRYITSFKAQKPYDSLSTTNPLANNYDIVRLTISATQGVSGDSNQQSVVTLTSDITLRNNLL